MASNLSKWGSRLCLGGGSENFYGGQGENQGEWRVNYKLHVRGEGENQGEWEDEILHRGQGEGELRGVKGRNFVQRREPKKAKIYSGDRSMK